MTVSAIICAPFTICTEYSPKRRETGFCLILTCCILQKGIVVTDGKIIPVRQVMSCSRRANPMKAQALGISIRLMRAVTASRIKSGRHRPVLSRQSWP